MEHQRFPFFVDKIPHIFQFCAREFIEQLVSHLVLRLRCIVVDNHTVQIRLATGRHCQRTQIGLAFAGRKNHIAALLHRLTQQIFQISGLVPPRSQAGQVIALDIQ